MEHYSKSAALYDKIYGGLDYATGAQQLLDLIKQQAPSARSVLEVACGTGNYLAFFTPAYDCTGLDLSEAMLAVARAKMPHIPFYQGDMRDFKLDARFDVILNLFSSIGYVQTLEGLQQAMTTMAQHLKPNGIAVVEPWIYPDKFYDGHIGFSTVEDPDLKIVRMHISRVQGKISTMDMHHLVATPTGIEHFSELHTLGLFTHEEYLAAGAAAGLQLLAYDDYGLIGRGLYSWRLLG